MQVLKTIILSLLIGANLQAWDGPVDYLYYGLSGGMAKLPSQIAEMERSNKKPLEKWQLDAIKSKENDIIFRKKMDESDKKLKAIEDRAKARQESRDQKADVLSMVDSESLTPAQITFLTKQARIKNTVAPEWYNNLVETDGKVIGYGSSENSSEASKNAQAEVARRLSGTVQATDISKKSEINGEYQNSFTSEVKVETATIRVQNLKKLQQAYVNGIWFYAIEYDGRELSDKIIGLSAKIKPSINLNYLNSSSFGMKLSKHLGFDPEMNLTFNRGRPMLMVGGETYWLSEYELEQFFSRTSTGTIVSSLSKDLYRQRERVDLSITTREQGYISVLWVTPDGVVGVVSENEEIYNTTLVTENKSLPNIRSKVSDHKELLVTIFSKIPIDVSEFRFEKVDYKTARDLSSQLDAQHKFHKLIELMKNYQHCTSVVNTESYITTASDKSRRILSKDESGVVYGK